MNAMPERHMQDFLSGKGGGRRGALFPHKVDDLFQVLPFCHFRFVLDFFVFVFNHLLLSRFSFILVYLIFRFTFSFC